MQVRTRMTGRGQVTVPREVREVLGLEPGDELVFEIGDGTVTLVPLREPLPSEEPKPFAAFIGMLPPLPQDARTFWREMRGRDEEE